MHTKRSLIVAFLSLTVAAEAQQIESYDAGVYTDIFAAAPSPVFAFVSPSGLNGSRALLPQNVQYSLNYLQRGPFVFSNANSTLEITSFFKIKQPTQTGLGYDALQLGFCTDRAA